MTWLIAAIGVLLVALVVAASLVLRHTKAEPETDFDSEEYLTAYFALEEFQHDDLRERLEHLRGSPDLR